MALDITTEEFYRLAGHDGSEVVFPWLCDPQCRAGFHIQEAIHVARQLGYGVTPFELFPQTMASKSPMPLLGMVPGGADEIHVDLVKQIRYGKLPHLHSNWDLFEELVNTSSGVIEGQAAASRHAVAFDYGFILNPDGEVFRYSRKACEARPFYTQCLWQVKKCSPN